MEGRKPAIRFAGRPKVKMGHGIESARGRSTMQSEGCNADQFSALGPKHAGLWDREGHSLDKPGAAGRSPIKVNIDPD
jgi:hypothetical protein